MAKYLMVVNISTANYTTCTSSGTVEMPDVFNPNDFEAVADVEAELLADGDDSLKDDGFDLFAEFYNLEDDPMFDESFYKAGGHYF